MSTRSKWMSLAGVVLAASLVVAMFPPRPDVVVIIEEIDPQLLHGVNVVGFHRVERDSIREEMIRKLGSRCGDAFKAAGLRSPAQMAWNPGILIMHARLLYLYDVGQLGLTYEQTRIKYKSEFSTGHAQGGTVPATLLGHRMTTDGRPRIFIHDSAFMGFSLFESVIFNRLDLGDVLTHELIHAGGQPPRPGWLGPLRHDLAGFNDYDKIMEACR
ncbi:MAG TPA: hypothetical protein VGX48_10540 [Pyrinomonadaceae bacterium]|nr:hypothetical protein [Pyrinomonadaceae bacterium]